MLFICCLPVAYTCVWLEPSWHCGPFRFVSVSSLSFKFCSATQVMFLTWSLSSLVFFTWFFLFLSFSCLSCCVQLVSCQQWVRKSLSHLDKVHRIKVTRYTEQSCRLLDVTWNHHSCNFVVNLNNLLLTFSQCSPDGGELRLEIDPEERKGYSEPWDV